MPNLTLGTSAVAFQSSLSNYLFHIKTLVISSTQAQNKQFWFVMNIYISSKNSILEHATPIKFRRDNDVPVINSMVVQ
jgi:hypothetical protein